MKRKHSLFVFLLAIGLVLACNFPRATPTPDQSAAFTAAAETVAVELTRSALTLPSPTVPLPSLTDTPTPESAPSPTQALSPTVMASPTAECDRAQFISDVTIPDGSVMLPGQTFTKTWRLRNIGTCTWTGYSLVFESGEAMSGPASSAIATTPPGGTVDVSVTLIAPATPGTYRGYWRIRNASGYLLPVSGGYQGRSFYVEIKVQSPSTATSTATSTPPPSGFDFHSRAPEAQWISCGSPCTGGTLLTFGGPDTDPNGFVMYRNGFLLEDGSTPAKVLEMHPMWVDNGVISGLYPAYAVQAGERFRARIGFLAGSGGACGAGNVIFQVNYKEGGVLYPLGSWTKSCNGSLQAIDIDLSALAGRTVQFALVVLANGSSAQDWAVWVNPRVEVP